MQTSSRPIAGSQRCARGQIAAIGAHGQTVRHQPDGFDGYTTQLLNGACWPNRAASTSSATCAAATSPPAAREPAGAGFPPRTSSVPQGGRGGAESRRHQQPEPARMPTAAPPASTPARQLPDGPGWIAPPGPALRRRRRLGCHRPGVARAACRLLAEPFFACRRPRAPAAIFSMPPGWSAVWPLANRPEDVQATCWNSALRCVAEALQARCPSRKLLVCGGGARNGQLMRRLQACCPASGASTEARGLPVDQVEAAAFAWLARQLQCCDGRAICRQVTGARGSECSGRCTRRDAGKQKKPPARRLFSPQAGQTEKLDPQPQVVVAFGFLITNWAPCRSSL
jgi:anhydro-N-acetylmuramic acid kinase